MSKKKSFNLKQFSSKLGAKPLIEQVEIFRESIETLSDKYGDLRPIIKKDFDAFLQEVESCAEVIYFREEQKFVRNLLKIYWKQKPDKLPDFDFLLENERLLAAIYLSLIQGRKNRAGKTLERILSLLFETLEYPFSYQPTGLDGRPDYILPSVDHYRRNPLNCIVFTSKRKIRERWRQIVTEGMRGIGFYLGTIDEELTEAELKAMLNSRVFVVCPKTIKEEFYKTIPNVLDYEQFFADHLEPKAKIWRKEAL